jgi:DNA-directed RNA polymerase subunit RPC12/RpoP
MLDVRRNVSCNYCGAKYHIKFTEDLPTPSFCAFCSEDLEQIDEEDDDGDLDYTDDERNEERYA